jgi:hypothetical protein
MPRLPRFNPIGIPQHIIQRANNRQVCFNSDEDILAYANWLFEYAIKHEVHTLTPIGINRSMPRKLLLWPYFFDTWRSQKLCRRCQRRGQTFQKCLKVAQFGCAQL